MNYTHDVYTHANTKLVRLGDVCRIINGRAYKKRELLNEGKYLVLRVGNFFSNKQWYYSDLELDEEKYCENGDLLYAWSASFGPQIWDGEKAIYHYHIWKTEFDEHVISKRYLYYWFCWDSEKIKNDHGAGTTMIHVTKKSMENRKLPLPSLSEQQRIVAILDDAFERIDAAIANTERNLANARELFESYLNKVFTEQGEGWEEKKLGDLLKSQPRNGWSPPARNHSDNGTPVLTLSSVTGHRFKPDKIKYTSARTNKDAHYWVGNGDLLMTRSNTEELVGHVAICSDISTPTIYPDLIMRMTIDNCNALTTFIYYQLRSPRLRRIIQESASGANPTMKKIKKSVVQGLPIVLPSLPQQTQSVQR
ncbi:restriction endonuclease subunit S [Oceanidesulfovibrio marinus]|uniref:restriction endonuclease subunit S n=1 Tax=Oceanidesulfovibrio marinus TaxID=370038 RepID=UPI00142EA52F|nr:restriction endonuclease subunit S [Oceanidesulfovibrio marinus]